MIRTWKQWRGRAGRWTDEGAIAAFLELRYGLKPRVAPRRRRYPTLNGALPKPEVEARRKLRGKARRRLLSALYLAEVRRRVTTKLIAWREAYVTIVKSDGSTVSCALDAVTWR